MDAHAKRREDVYTEVYAYNLYLYICGITKKKKNAKPTQKQKTLNNLRNTLVKGLNSLGLYKL